MKFFRLAATFFILFLPRGYAWSTHATPQDQPAKPHAVRSADAASVEERARHLLLAGKTKPPGAAELGEALTAEKDESPVVRAAALQALGEWAAWSTEMLALREKSRGLTPDSDEKLAAQAVLEKAGLTNDTYAVFTERFGTIAASLSKSLKTEKDPEVLKETIQSLTKIPRLAARLAPSLLHLMETEDASLRAAAKKLANSLPTPPASFVPDLVPYLNAKDIEVRYLAFKWLAGLKEASAPAVPQLTAALKDPAPGIRDSAIDALGAVGPAAREAVPDLHRLLKKSGREAARQNSLLRALGNIGPAASATDREVADLAYAADTASEALEALAKIAPSSSPSLEAIGHAIASEDPPTRAAALRPAGQAALTLAREKKDAALRPILSQLKQVLIGDPVSHLRNQAAAELGKVFLADPRAVRELDMPIESLAEIALAAMTDQPNTKPPSGLVDLVAATLAIPSSTRRLALLEKLEVVFRHQSSLPFSVPLAEVLLRSAESDSAPERNLAHSLMARWCETDGDREVVPVLIKLTENPKTEIAKPAASKLATLTRPEDHWAAPILARMLDENNQHEWMLVHALKSLGPAGTEAVGRAFDDPDPRLRRHAINLTIRDPEWGEALLDRAASHIDDPIQSVRTAAVQALAEAKQIKPEYLPKLLQAKGEADEERRGWLALAIARAGGANAELPWLLERTHEKSASVRSRSTGALAYTRDPRAQRRLIELTQDPDDNTRQAAVHILGSFPPSPELVRGLAGALGDPLYGGAAAQTLGFWGPTSDLAIPQALAIINGEGPKAGKANALNFLGTRTSKAKDLMPIFQAALKDPENILTIPSLRALATFGPDAAPATPQVVGWLEAHPDDWLGYKEEALRVLTHIGRTATREMKDLPQKLTSLYQTRDDSRPYILNALSSVSGAEAAAALLRERPIAEQLEMVERLPMRTREMKEVTLQLLTVLSQSDDGNIGEPASRRLRRVREIRPADEP